MVKAGVGAVIAIQADKPIADLAAIMFNHQFYAMLARGKTVSTAFEQARTRVALDARVGDSHPPQDAQGRPEEPWSKRFELWGDGSIVLGQRSGAGGYQERGAVARVSGSLRERNAHFVGRAKEIVEIVTAFSQGPRVALYGPGGVGKTELARGVAWWHIDRARTDAVLWASAGRDEAEYKLNNLASLLSLAGRVFELPITEQSKFDEQKQVVREYLDRQGACLILDNWETIDASSRRELWDFVLNLPETVRVLVTSRDVLPAKDARNIELDTLTPDDAARLFLQIVHNAGYFDRHPRLSEEEMAILSAICDRLSGYPLAIEVVAGQTVSRTLGEIWDDLQRFPKNVLEGKNEITGEPRGIWTSLDLSYNILPDAEKALFRQMGILLAPAAADDVAALMEIAEPHRVLDTLVKRSLVQAREGAYALLPIVREYAQDQLKEAGQDPREWHRRAVSYYEQKGTLESKLIASEHLFELAMRFPLSDAAKLFCEFTKGFYYDLVTRGYWVEAQRKAKQLIAIARALGNKLMEAQAIGESANRYYDIGNYEGAADLQQQSLKLAEELGNKEGIALSLHRLATLAQDQGNYPEADRLYQQSLKLLEELGDKHGIERSLHQIATLAHAQGNYPEADRLGQQSLKLAEELGDKLGIAGSLHQLATLAQDQGNYPEAARLYRQSLKLVEELGDKSGIARSLGQLGKLAIAQKQMKEALGYLLRAHSIFEELQSPYRKLALKDIASVRGAIGEEKFTLWITELSADGERIKGWLEQEQAGEKILAGLRGIAEKVVEAQRAGLAEEITQQLAQMEGETREQGVTELADFLAVLRGLLAGEDVTGRIAALAQPLQQIIEQARG